MRAAEHGLGINAGHDLDHENLVLFRDLPHLKEVSIGHAMISRAIFDGLVHVVREYLSGAGTGREVSAECVEQEVMTRDSWILGLAGVAFGILIGWIIGSQSGRPSTAAAPIAQQAAPQQGPGAGGQPGQANAGGAPSGVQAPPPLDEAQLESARGAGRRPSA